MCNQDFFGLVAAYYLESVYTIADNQKGRGKGLYSSTAVPTLCESRVDV